MGQRRSQRQLRDQALVWREKRQKSVSSLALAFGVSKATMQQWLTEARRERRIRAAESGDGSGGRGLV